MKISETGSVVVKDAPKPLRVNQNGGNHHDDPKHLTHVSENGAAIVVGKVVAR